MPGFNYVKTDFPDTVVCGICSEPFVDPISVCEEEHPFCKECLLGWLTRENPVGTRISFKLSFPAGTPFVPPSSSKPFVFAPSSAIRESDGKDEKGKGQGAGRDGKDGKGKGEGAGKEDDDKEGDGKTLKEGDESEEKKDEEVADADRNRDVARPCPFAGCIHTITLAQVESAKVSKQLARIAATMEVFCMKKASGCTWRDQRNSLERHLSDACPCVPVPCTAGCGMKVQRRHMEKHTSESGPCPKAAEARREREKARLADEITAMLDEAGDLVVFNVRGETIEAAYTRVTKRPESLLALYVDGHRERFGKEKPVWIDSNPAEFSIYLHWVTSAELRMPEDVEDDVRLRIEFRKWGDLGPIGPDVPFLPHHPSRGVVLRLDGCDLSGLNFSQLAIAGESDFDNTVNRGTLFSSGHKGCSYNGADLRGSNLNPLHINWRTFIIDERTKFDEVQLSCEPNLAMWASVIAAKFDLPSNKVQAHASNAQRRYPTLAGIYQAQTFTEFTEFGLRKAMENILVSKLGLQLK